MAHFWLWVLAGAVVLAGLVLLVAYIESEAIVHPARPLSPYLFPDQLNYPYENAVFTTKDGVTIKGWFIPAEGESSKTVIGLHGWGNNRCEPLTNVSFLRDLGFNFLCFDFRCRGESGGNVSSLIYLEGHDFEAALDYLKERKPECAQSVGVYGISMGAAVALSQAALHPEIKCVAAEASFYSYEKVVGRWAWIFFKVPYYPVVPLSLWFVRKALGVDQEPYSPVYSVPKINPRPIFFIHGSHDDLAFLKDAKKLYSSAGEPKDMWVVAGSSHAKCAETGGQEYKDRLGAFFKKYL